MTSPTLSIKNNNRLVHNNNLVQALNRYQTTGTLNTPKAQLTLEHYTHLQAKLRRTLPYREYKHFTVSKQKSCDICGYPVTSILTKHHVIPQSKGGKSGPIVMLCPTCHCSIHMSVDRGNIDRSIIDYLEGIDGAVEKFGKYVRMCAEA